MTQNLSDNPELKLAREFVEYTHCHVFLTGKAGTGKTTFLSRLKQESAKRLIITAPTGVAAINAGGVTLHSFFQLPFGPFIPGSEAYESGRQRMFRFSKEKKKIIRALDLLVIDEISMVRADLLDSVDAVLRRHRRSDRPFGGVQLLMIGDLHQLSPVARKEEWHLLKEHYETVYFFSSHALDRNRLVTVELKQIFRQSDSDFIHILNRVRENREIPTTLERLNQRVNVQFTPEPGQGWITLTTHNNKADAINKGRLALLNQAEYRFLAKVSGEFPDHTFPAPDSLVLKKGAQVMFLKNDTSEDKLYYNGKIGRIVAISSGNIAIQCPGESNVINVEPVEWENIKYTVDEAQGEITEDVIGKFKQYPLKLAWAVTIHKSQGLTFDRCVIDAVDAFAHGQVYVALSRCKTLDGIVLSSPVRANGLGADPAVLNFCGETGKDMPPEALLSDAKLKFQQALLVQCFDFGQLKNQLNYLIRLILGNQGVIHVSGLSAPEELRKKADMDIFTVGQKFILQMTRAFSPDRLPESDPYIKERTAKASAWFQEKFNTLFTDLLENFHIETDNTVLKKKLGNSTDNLIQEIQTRLAGIKSCEQGFSCARYLRFVSGTELTASSRATVKKAAPDYRESDISHPDLFETFKAWRKQKALNLGIAPFQILHQRVLIQIVVTLPDNRTALKKINGVGTQTIKKYGDDILSMVTAYRKEHQIETVDLPGPPPEPDPGVPKKQADTSKDTGQVSFDMFNQGMTPAKIAKERGLVENTVLTHLSEFIRKGALDISRLVPEEKVNTIAAALEKDATGSLKEVKTVLGEDYSYGEIRLVMGHVEYLSNTNPI